MAYIPQLTPTVPTDTYTDNVYHAWNPFENTYNPYRPWQPNYGMPNCTAYAFGRFWSLANPQTSTDNRPALSLGNAKEWYGYTQDGYQRGQIPKLGAIICYDDAPGEDTGGHVAIVEEIFSDGSIRVSNSGYTDDQSQASTWFFWTQLLPNTYVYSSKWTFQGFIYNPFAESESEDIYLWSKAHRRKKNDTGKSKYGNSLRNGKFI